MVISVVSSRQKELSASQQLLIDKISQLAPYDFGERDATYAGPTEPESLLDAIANQLKINPDSIDDIATADIHTVSKLFDELFTKKNLNLQMRWLLAHLRIPLLRVAVETTDFLQSPTNALALLNSLVRSSVTWTPTANKQRDSLYNKICAVIETLSRKNSESDFTNCYADFELFIKAEDRRAKLIEERIVSAEQADSKKAEAVKVANQHISNKFLGLNLPSIVNTFLATTWNHVLFFIYNKEPSKDSADWEWATILEDELLSFAGLHDNDRGNFLQQLEEQLTAVGIDQRQAEHWIKKLEPELKKIQYPAPEPSRKPEKPASLSQQPKPQKPGLNYMTHSSEMQPADYSQGGQPTTAGNLDDKNSILNDHSFDHAALAEKIDHLRMGSWVRYTEQGVETKLRVAAILKHTDTWVFVNRNGSKAGSFNRQQLLEMLVSEQMVLIEDATHFDNTLESVISNLRRF